MHHLRAGQIILRRLLLTRVCEQTATGATERTIRPPRDKPTTYWYQPLSALPLGERESRTCGYNFVPVVLNADGSPWREANAYLIHVLESSSLAAIGIDNARAIATDLVDYRRFLDETGTDFLIFGQNRLARPVYRYRRHLVNKRDLGELSMTVASRRIASIKNFYRWLLKCGLLHAPFGTWEEKRVYLRYQGTTGTIMKSVVTTDLSISRRKENDPTSPYISDGGKLRPLPLEEQKALIEVLHKKKNIEMKLILLLVITTGARIQTALTLRQRHFQAAPPSNNSEVRIYCGPGTGIDTKKGKNATLHVPTWLYKIVRNYAFSRRAQRRREKTTYREDPYLFLTNRGTPYYVSKADRSVFQEDANLAHASRAEPVRQYVHDHILPELREQFGPDYSFSPQDLRATAGMNMTDHQMTLVEKGLITLTLARDYVRTRMWHEHASTTDLYLDFRKNRAFFLNIQNDYEKFLDGIMGKFCHEEGQ